MIIAPTVFTPWALHTLVVALHVTAEKLALDVGALKLNALTTGAIPIPEYVNCALLLVVSGGPFMVVDVTLLNPTVFAFTV